MTAAPRIRVLGVGVDCIDMQGTLAWVGAAVEAGPPCRQVATVNPEFVMHARRDPRFKAVLEGADLCVADGIGVRWALDRQACRLPGRVAGADLVPALAALCAERGWRPYLLGAAPGVAAEAGRILAQRNPGLEVAGAAPGSPHPGDDGATVAMVAATGADIVLVAYGHPKQEFWIARNRHRLPAAVAIGVGGSFDFITGRRRRAPSWVQSLHLEWLHRLVQEPARARRMAVLPRFAFEVMRSAAPRSGTS